MDRDYTQMRNRVHNINPSTHAGFPCLTSSAATKTSGMMIPAALRAEVAYFRVAEVHMAHFGSGNVLPDPSCRGWERKHPPSADLANKMTPYVFDNGASAWKFDDAPAVSSTLNDCQLENFGLALCANLAI